jgi:PAS domain S-box-containing protein
VGGAILDSGLFGGAAEATAFISSVLEASTEYSMIATDLDGVILLWNEGARRLYGYEPGESIGRHKSMLHAQQDVVAGLPRVMIDRAVRHGKWEGTVDRVRKDGTNFTARVVMTLRRSETGQPIGFLLMSSDMSEELRLTAERDRSHYIWSVLESTPDAMVIVNQDGNVQLAKCRHRVAVRLCTRGTHRPPDRNADTEAVPATPSWSSCRLVLRASGPADGSWARAFGSSQGRRRVPG